MPSSQGSPARTPARAAALAFLAAGATLFVQVLVHRMVSAKLLNNYAFLVISLTMLGFALSGVLLTRLLGRFLRDLARRPHAQRAPGSCSPPSRSRWPSTGWAAGDQATASMTGFLREFLRWLPTALLFAIPFTFSGLMIGALLSDPDLPAPRVYAFDLAGSALGAFAVIPAIRHLGVEASTLLACALLLAGTVALAPPRRAVARLAAVARPWRSRARPWRGTALRAWSPGRARCWPSTAHPRPALRRRVRPVGPGGADRGLANAAPGPRRFNFPALIGDDRAFLERFRRILTQNDFAFTYMVDWDGRPESLRGIERTIYAAAYEASSVRFAAGPGRGRRRRLRHPHRAALRRSARSRASRSTAPRSTS